MLNLSGKALGELVKEFMTNKKSIKFRTKGHSMIPVILQGDIITISPYGKGTPVQGDIVAYINPETQGLIVHRLIKIARSAFVAKGDNCRHKDAVYGTNLILGYVQQINKKNSMRNKLLISPFKKTLAILSTIGLFFIINKFLKRIQLLI